MKAQTDAVGLSKGLRTCIVTSTFLLVPEQSLNNKALIIKLMCIEKSGK